MQIKQITLKIYIRSPNYIHAYDRFGGDIIGYGGDSND